MTPKEVAHRLADTAADTRRNLLLEEVGELSKTELAHALKEVCLDSWTSNPGRAIRAAQSLTRLAAPVQDSEIKALSAWANGIAAMVNGQLRRAVTCFNQAEQYFQALGQQQTAAATQVAKLYPLALLGRYDEAIGTGLKAREIFLHFNDLAAAGRVENNLGNIFQRSDRFAEAEQFLRLARERFIALQDFKSLAQITNSLAYVLSYRYRFREADAFYLEALEFANQSGQAVTRAEIESNIGYFSLFQGRYSSALEFLERARRSYAELEMPHQSAIAELEMADAYTELNLFAEASEIYSRIIPLFAEIGMPIEHAHALANYARAQFVTGNPRKAYSLLATARQLFNALNSEVGEATVLLTQAQFLFAERKFAEALKTLGQAELPLERAGIKGTSLAADCLRAEAWRELGNYTDARALLEETLVAAKANEIPPLVANCLMALGLTEKADGEQEKAEDCFRQAISVIENLRAPLPSEDFRTAFFGNKLAPYNNLMQICLADENRVAEAFQLAEQSRSRALAEMVQKSAAGQPAAGDSNLNQAVAALRRELNWLYNEIHQPTSRNTGRNLALTLKLHQVAREREAKIAEILRQVHLRQPSDGASTGQGFALAALQANLGDSVLLEFAAVEGEFTAFVLTAEGIRAFPRLCREEEVNNLLSDLYFQLDTLRHEPANLLPHLYELTLKARHILQDLYRLLLRPLETAIGLRRLIVAPHRALHYLPFHALYDGLNYLVETREIVYTPSASVLQKCLEKPHRKFHRALLAGVADERIPFASEEVKSLASLFPNSVVLLDKFAGFEELAAHAPSADVLHLACHGQFRSENPLFSSLKLADRWLTVGDVYDLRLNADLVVLSACETGRSRIAPGDELLGLARGFFSAGASSLLLSLWNVHDVTTMELMRSFYQKLCGGARPAAALRQAQSEMLKKRPHPFFWSPFFLIGRW